MIKRFTRLITAVCLFGILYAQFTPQDSETGKILMNFTPGDVSFETQGEYTKFIPLNGIKCKMHFLHYALGSHFMD